MADENLQHFESTEDCINEEASQNVTRYDQDPVSNKYNQCKYGSSKADDLRRHLKTHDGEKPKNAISVIMHPPMQVL